MYVEKCSIPTDSACSANKPATGSTALSREPFCARVQRAFDTVISRVQAKWGPRQEGQPPCKIEVKEPITGNMTLPQRPFGNLAYLQRFWVQEDPDFDNVPILAGLGREQESFNTWAAAAPKPATSKLAGEQTTSRPNHTCFRVDKVRSKLECQGFLELSIFSIGL